MTGKVKPDLHEAQLVEKLGKEIYR